MLVCGSRHFNDKELMEDVLKQYDISTVMREKLEVLIPLLENMQKNTEFMSHLSRHSGINMVRLQVLFAMLKCSEKDNPNSLSPSEDQTAEELKT